MEYVNMDKIVSVVILTHNRSYFVHRAIESVLNQYYKGYINIYVCLDRCGYGDILASTYKHLSENRNIYFLDMNVPPSIDISRRLARIRNKAVEYTKANSFISFLDDDNQYLPNHISSLLSKLNSSDAKAVHSWRRLIDKRGFPWFADRFPWSIEDTDLKEFSYYCEQGILHPGSDILRDSVRLRNGEIGMVDTSCWLFNRELILNIPFPENRTETDSLMRITEDDLMLKKIIENGIETVSTCLPTILYRLGGYSNI
jgi:glycosyltransferase involved in cell wall biosynthesis